jgi:hypothetical protein
MQDVHVARLRQLVRSAGNRLQPNTPLEPSTSRVARAFQAVQRYLIHAKGITVPEVWEKSSRSLKLLLKLPDFVLHISFSGSPSLYQADRVQNSAMVTVAEPSANFRQ